MLKGINESSTSYIVSIQEFEPFLALMKHFRLIKDELQDFGAQRLPSPTSWWETSWMAGILTIDPYSIGIFNVNISQD